MNSSRVTHALIFHRSITDTGLIRYDVRITDATNERTIEIDDKDFVPVLQEMLKESTQKYIRDKRRTKALPKKKPKQLKY